MAIVMRSGSRRQHLLSSASKRFLPTGFKGRNYLQNINSNFKSDVPLIATHFDQNERCRLIKKNEKYSTTAESIRQASIPKMQNLITRATLMDFEKWQKCCNTSI